MCVYNGSRFLKEAIDSILSQTFTNFEFIIWNDGSTDNSENIILSYNDSRIHYFYHENTGLGRALDMACRKARGKYIARMDDDDISLSNRLEIEYNYMESHPECVMCFTPQYFIDEDGDIVGELFTYTKDYILKKLLLEANCICHPSVMMRKDTYFMTQGYPGTRSAQDRLLWSKLGKLGKFANLKIPLIKYRIVSTSISNQYVQTSSYFQMLLLLRRKMVLDNQFLEKDVELYNLLISMIPRKKTPSVYKKHKEELVFFFLNVFLPESLARNILLFFKNLYGYYKIHRMID